jgi:DNA/RNA-binding domain of Phe-tRNA-synthetase-like protein
MLTTVRICDHPLLRCVAFTTRFPAPLSEMPAANALAALLAPQAAAPFQPDEQLRTDMRAALRVHGYKPTGRGKPASEYLVRAAAEGGLRPINLAVDACNVVSLHSGFPISVIDLDRATPPFVIDTAPAGSSYIFNAAGQEIALDGLPCLFDADGPCANAVKDSQRTKTGDATHHTLSVVWGSAGHEDRLAAAARWYRLLLEETGATTAAA